MFERLEMENFLCFLVVCLGFCQGAISDLHAAVGRDFEERQCGYEFCELGKADMLNVHLVPHTHDDVGWKKTVDQYYYGANRTLVPHVGVQYILDTVLQELKSDPAKRFIYVEMAFFTRWWNELGDEDRGVVKSLVNQGRLEFINGGWCMNDEATPHYSATIDQMTLGLHFLNSTFGECGRPRVAWQIDPFGHSSTQANIFAQMGFDGLFFARLDYDDKIKRAIEKTLEMVWRASPKNLGRSSDLFTGVLFWAYHAPPGYNFDIEVKTGVLNQPIMDDPRLENYNVNKRVEEFIRLSRFQKLNYSTNHIIVPMGGDFMYGSAHHWYKNMDKLINYVNAKQANGSKVNVFYSTPSCYLYALNKVGQTYTLKTDDFFPYASDIHTYWTGYFTSRPALKYYVQKANNFLQACKQVDALARLGPENGKELDALKRSLGVAQHHDAVSGTEKQHVANDYAKRISKGLSQCQKTVSDAFAKIMPKDSRSRLPQQFFCPLLNISSCNVTERSTLFAVTVYNPVAHNVNTSVRLPVVGTNFTVLGYDGVSVIPSEAVPISKSTRQIPGRNGSIATHELVFIASNVPALGWNTYFVRRHATFGREKRLDRKTNGKRRIGSDYSISNGLVAATFDGVTGLLKTLQNLEQSVNIPITQNFFYYRGMGFTSHENHRKPRQQSSGAYIFRPNGTERSHGIFASISNISRGEVVEEVYQTFAPWIQQVVRIYKHARHVEFEWTVGPIPFSDGYGKEVISKFNTTLATDEALFTNNNGREIMRRKLNKRKTWKLNVTEPIAGNYYPVNGQAILRATQGKLVDFIVQNDRPEGVASLSNGSLELMIHRRLLFDDHKGVDEPLNETGISGLGLVVRGTHKVSLGEAGTTARHYREIGYQQYMSPILSFSTMPALDPTSYVKLFKTTFSGLQENLPRNVNILTLEQWERGRSILLRLEHIYEKGEDPKLSEPVTVDLAKILTHFEIITVEELTLAANQALKDATRLHWKTRSAKTEEFKKSKITDNLQVTLDPMQIRTFLIDLKPVSENI